ncbi:hypothetical protein [Rathayibacter festucae]|uniref:hypothetical protein n=1 Tax=Rathayibacter festucae TaxID=110937 RepID=UPI002A6B0F92|nr:hypothetical protein [Rathayibacter festucae]MDY0913397.1 hypothetical protein [Rathayibacter festucae]
MRRATEDRLQRRLDAAEAAIAAHVLSSDWYKRIEAITREGAGDEERVSARLAEEGLPELHRLGLFYLRSWPSWWWLHNRRRAARLGIERHRGRVLRTREKLQRELEAIDAAMARHPHVSGQIERIDAIFAECGGDDRVINERLAAEGLPTIPKLAGFYLRTLVSWLRLSRRRKVTLRRIERLDG